MAHLIKLKNYVSRYQFDLQRYTGQYTRMKKERWEHVKNEWYRVNDVRRSNKQESFDNWFEEADRGFILQALSRLRNITKRKRKQKEITIDESEKEKRVKGKSLDEVKSMFYENLFQAQLRWASSSLLEQSSLDVKYRHDSWLRFLLQQLPDNYFVLYEPIVLVKKAPVDFDIILINPTEIICLYVLEGKETSVFETSSGKFWNEYVDEKVKHRISPMFTLDRCASIVTGIMNKEGLDVPIRRVVLSPSSFIEDKAPGLSIDVIDRRRYESWLTKTKRHPSPIKSKQLRVASAILNYTETVSFPRFKSFIDEKNEDHTRFEKEEF